MIKINFDMCVKNKSYKDFSIIDQYGANNLHIDILNKLKQIPEDGLFVELGVFCGGSLLTFYDIINKKSTNFIGIDCWDNNTMMNGIESHKYDSIDWNKYIDIQKECYKILNEIISTYDMNIKLITLKNTHDIYNNFENNSIDFIHIDSDHNYHSVYNELNTFYPKIKKNGVILLDDWNYNEVQSAIKSFCIINNLQYNFYENKSWIFIN